MGNTPTNDRQVKGKTTAASNRRDLLIEGVLQGKSPARAAREAGYSESYARVNVYRGLAKASIRQRIQQRLAEAKVDTNEVIGTLVSHMRADLAEILPQNEILKQAKEAGLSHLIKRIRVKERFIPREGKEPEREVTTEIEVHDSQSAAKHLCNVFGLEKMPAANPNTLKKLDDAVDRFIEKAAQRGIEVTPEKAREKLMPYFEAQGVN